MYVCMNVHTYIHTYIHHTYASRRAINNNKYSNIKNIYHTRVHVCNNIPNTF